MTLFADISEFQCPVDDSYPYPILSIRSNDGTYRDGNFVTNYAWMRRALDSGRLACGIIYCYWRSNVDDTFATMRSMIDGNGGLHPKVILMVDLESGGNPGGDQSWGVNHMIDLMAAYAGNRKRVIVYANAGDFYSMWCARDPASIGGTIGAGYGQNPGLPNQIAHQYTDGVYGAGQGLPMAAPPFGHCDMNSADDLSADQFAALCGIGSEDLDMDANTLKTIIFECLETYVGPGISDGKDVRYQITGSRDLIVDEHGTVDLGKSFPGLAELGFRTLTDAVAAICAHLGIRGCYDPKPNGDGIYIAPATATAPAAETAPNITQGA